MFSNLTDRFVDPEAVLSIHLCLQALDDIIGPFRSSVISKNNIADFNSAIDFFLSRNDSADTTYELSFVKICELLNIQYSKVMILIEDIFPKIEKEFNKKIQNGGKENAK